MVVNIAADDDNTETGKGLFIGREKEINYIIEGLNDNRGSILLLVGESGIGKSALLDEVYRRLSKEDDQRNRPFVGYYSKKESLIAPSQFLLYPFTTVLASLVNEAKKSLQPGEKIEGTLNRIKKASVGFGREEMEKIAEAIIDDAAKKAGLEQTFKVAKSFWSRFKAEKTGLMLAEDYAAKNKDESLKACLGIFRSLAEEFKERRFVLLFDRFESVGKASTDFFLNFVKFLKPQERFDIIVSFRTDDTTWNDPTTRRVYEEIEQKLLYDLGARKLSIGGLSAEDIGKWIKAVRGISLPLIPDLQRIKENSAGLPLLLDEWIKSSEKLGYEEISREKRREMLCSQEIRREIGLSEQDQVRLYKMSILLQPLKHKRLATYLEMDENVDLVRPFVKRLIENRIFDERFKWFRHDLVQRCFEHDLDPEEKTSYHERAAEFFGSLMEEELNRQNSDNTNIEEEREGESHSIAISYAYHLHMAGGTYHEKSFSYNKELAECASKIGDLDIAERSYKRAIADAEYLGQIRDKMDCLFDMTTNVYSVWARYEEAVSNYESLLKYYDSINDSDMRAVALNNIAIIHTSKGEYDQALKLYNDSLEINRQIGDQNTIGGTLNNIAVIHYEKGEYDQALKLYNDSLEINRQIGDQNMIGKTLNNISNIHYEKGEYDQALKLYNDSLEIMRKIGDQNMIGGTLNNIANTLIQKEEYEESLFYVLQAYEILERLDSPSELQRSLDILNHIEGKLGSEVYQRLVEKVKRKLS